MRFSLVYALLTSTLINAVSIPASEQGPNSLSVRREEIIEAAVGPAYTPPNPAPALDTRATKKPAKKPATKKKPAAKKPAKKPAKSKTPAKGKTKSKAKTPAKPKSKKGTAKAPALPSEKAMSLKCKVPKNKAFFWSGVHPTGYQYAKQARLTTDETAYPPGYVYQFGKDKLKGKYSRATEDKFQRRFSKVFATKAMGVVHVMVPWKAGPRRERIFHTDEWPVLKASLAKGKVTQIIQVNPDNFKETRKYDPKAYGLSKREARSGINNTVEARWDVDLDALNEVFLEARMGEA